MTDIIHLLPDSVANQIAAGEVIQRPASCLKELVENALDAKASNIRIIVRDAGRTLFQVVDDGKGMSTTDARMAFERHATSKISQAQDLFHLSTMGFRGEALASICAVAQVEMQTRRREDEVGTLLEIEGSRVLRQEPTQCPVGTNIKVKNLFYNVPARRRFLKTDQTELRNLMTDYQRIVLVYPQVQFTFVNNDEILNELTPGTTKQRIEAVFGQRNKSYTAQLVEVSVESELVTLHGFVGKPEYSTRTNQQFMFVNGRYMRHPYFHKAVMSAYSGLLAAESQPSYFLYFDVDPQRIDVNIHPTKTEIKFADEQAIFQILLAAVRESLGKFNVSPAIDFNAQTFVPIPSDNGYRKAPINAPTISLDPSYNPFHRGDNTKKTIRGWEKLYEPINGQSPERIPPSSMSTDTPAATTLFDLSSLSQDTPLVQWMQKYILLPVDGGLLCVHQHRAHVQLLFGELMEELTSRTSLTQPLLFPEVLDLTTDEASLLRQVMPELIRTGFVLSELSPTSYSIQSAPSLLGQKNPAHALLEVLHEVDKVENDSIQERWHERIALALADQMAITAGQPLNHHEMYDIIKRLMVDHRASRYLVDGRTIYVLLTEETMQAFFKK